MSSLDYFTNRLPDLLDELREFVAIETPTGEVAQAERAGAFLRARFEPLGTLETAPLPGYGPLIRVRRPGTGSRVLLLGHYDTVWPIGSWTDLWREADGRVFAPGVYDMKCGLLFILWLLRSLDASGLPHPDLDVVLDPDEEVGSLASQSTIKQVAAEADFALVLEPSDLTGSLKLARKASGDFFIEAIGRPAHQGAEPELGVNAVVEAAHQVLRLVELQDLAAGTTVGPNMLSGGTSSNTVADRARIAVDVRAWTDQEVQRLENAIRSLEPVLEGSSLHVTGRWNRPPMEPTRASRELFERARAIGADLGLAFEGARWGGSSDANFAAAAGAVTIDGFGPLGEGAHQPIESIVVDSIPPRIALLTDLVVSLARPPEEWLSSDAVAELRTRRSPR
jgi:glutamate carboxypeptidase